MRTQPDQIEIRERACLGVVFVYLGERYSEFAVAMTGRDVRMRAGVEVRVDSQADRRASAHPGRDARHAMQFGGGLDVDHQDARLDRGFQFLVGLAHAGKNDLARLGAGLKTAHQLAHRNDVEARAHRGEELEHA